MSNYSENKLSAADSVQGHIIWQQADKLARMSALGDLVQEQWEDWRVREEDTRCIMDAEEVAEAADTRAMQKATERAKWKARELEGEMGGLPKKKGLEC